MILENVLGAIGNTPLVGLNRVVEGLRAQVAVKLEFINPGGSIKDRMALHIVRKAIEEGKLKPSTTVVEVTSGNTGTSLAMLGAIYDFKVVLVVSPKVSQEKIGTMRAFGAEVVVVDGTFKEQRAAALEIGRKHGDFFYVDQDNNPYNAEAHYLTTGPEIWEQTGGRVTHWVAGIGTGGTLMGTCRFLKEKNPAVKCIGVDPKGSIIYPTFKGMKDIRYEKYEIEGIGSDIIPGQLDFDLIDDMIQVDDATSFEMARRLAMEEGIFAGGSSGSNVHAALRVAERLDENGLVVTVIPDSGCKYVSKLFKGKQ